jgi:FolB domain-containing protein
MSRGRTPLPPDVVEIDGLNLRTVIGIFDFERDRRQDVVVSLRIHTDIRAAARSDDIADALDYKRVTKRVIELVEGSQFFLVETLAERIAACVLEEPRAERVEVRVEKPGALRHARTVAVRIVRGRGAAP